jgi:hypothetical protein
MALFTQPNPGYMPALNSGPAPAPMPAKRVYSSMPPPVSAASSEMIRRQQQFTPQTGYAQLLDELFRLRGGMR